MDVRSSGQANASARVWFVIVSGDESERVLEVFDRAGWSTAIETYVERIRAGALPVGVSLRPARQHERPTATAASASAEEAATWTLLATAAAFDRR